MILIKYTDYEFDCIICNVLCCFHNDYIKSVEYIDNGIDEIVVECINLSITAYRKTAYRNLENQFHNPIGPAFISCYPSGERQYFFQNGTIHRLDGPAVQHFDLDGKLHNEEYYINGIQYSKETFNRLFK